MRREQTIRKIIKEIKEQGFNPAGEVNKGPLRGLDLFDVEETLKWVLNE